jgi:NAD-dependent deacetylase
MELSKVRLTVLTGAGLSAESGIPTYRGTEGIYTKIQNEMGMPIESLVSLSTLVKNPSLFWRYWSQITSMASTARPNKAHYLLKKLSEECGTYLEVTQNIDGLSLSSGVNSEHVIELHGHARSFSCMACGSKSGFYTEETSAEPFCKCSHGLSSVRPDVVLFQENIDSTDYSIALNSASLCNIMLVIGTELHFEYLLDILENAKRNGAFIICINPERPEFLEESVDRFDLYREMFGKNIVHIKDVASSGLQKAIQMITSIS